MTEKTRTEEALRRACKRCLLRDFPYEDQYREMLDQIEQMSPDFRVDDEVYEERLALCRTCPYLFEGMCRICGCYVEWRAAFRVKRCPQVHPRWDVSEE